jgi:hypothetical protein
MPANRPAVFRVHWLPGTDHLLGTCHCGAERLAQDPVELWAWLHAHPVGHQSAAAEPRQNVDPPRSLATV